MAVSSVLIFDCPVPSRRRILPTFIGVSTCPSDTVTRARNRDRMTSLTILPALSILDQQLFYSRQVCYFVTMTFYRLCAQSQPSDIDAYDYYRKATGAIFDSETGLLRMPSDQYQYLKSLFVKIAGREFELIPNAQIFPLALNTVIGGSSDYVYLMVGTSGGRTGFFPCVLSTAFLERYYTVFNASNQSIGFASTQFTNLKTN
jgi:hypothetical protein